MEGAVKRLYTNQMDVQWMASIGRGETAVREGERERERDDNHFKQYYVVYSSVGVKRKTESIDLRDSLISICFNKTIVSKR